MSLLVSGLLAAAATAQADDGDPDTTFSGDGKATFAWPTMVLGQEVFDMRTVGMTVLGDGSTVTLAELQTIGDDRFDACVVTKFRPSGAVDITFGNGGWQLANFQPELSKESCLSVFPTAGNGMLVVGYIPTMGAPRSIPALSKLLADGTFDPSFGVGGKVVIPGHPFGADASIRFEDAIQAPDGKILMAGSCEECGFDGFDGSQDFLVLRINANGSVDTSLGTSGWKRFSRAGGLDELATAVAVDSVGRIVLGGYRTEEDNQINPQRPMLARMLVTGQADLTFNGGGFVDLNVLASMAVSAIAIDRYNDSVVVAMNITNSPAIVPGAVLMRILRTGVVDNFGTGNLVTFQQEQGTNITKLAIRGDRRITAAGWIDPNGADTRDFFAARLHFTGGLDTSFDGNGSNRYTFTFANNSIDVPTAMILSGSRPVLAGTLENEPAERFANGVLRLQSDLIFGSRFELGGL